MSRVILIESNIKNDIYLNSKSYMYQDPAKAVMELSQLLQNTSNETARIIDSFRAYEVFFKDLKIDIGKIDKSLGKFTLSLSSFIGKLIFLPHNKDKAEFENDKKEIINDLEKAVKEGKKIKSHLEYLRKKLQDYTFQKIIDEVE